MEEKTYEQAIEELEKIVNELENQELSLDESLENFKKGMELSVYCSKKLEDAEKKISILIEQSDKSMLEEDIEIESEK